MYFISFGNSTLNLSASASNTYVHDIHYDDPFNILFKGSYSDSLALFLPMAFPEKFMGILLGLSNTHSSSHHHRTHHPLPHLFSSSTSSGIWTQLTHSLIHSLINQHHSFIDTSIHPNFFLPSFNQSLCPLHSLLMRTGAFL